MKKTLKITIGGLTLFGLACLVWAHSIDYLGLSGTFNVAATKSGGGGNSAETWTVTNPIAPTTGTVTFDLKYQIDAQGNATGYPKTVNNVVATATRANNGSPIPATVSVGGITAHTFNSSSDTFTDHITITAPTTEDTYTVFIAASDNIGQGQTHLGKGNGIYVVFTVMTTLPPCEPVTPDLAVASQCIVLHDPNPVTLTATLTDPDTSNGIGGKTIKFYVDGTLVDSDDTDSSGVATVSYNASSLPVGDHEVHASFTAAQGACDYTSTDGYGNLGVMYLFIGFQQPINADGSSIFKGGAIPVKIRLSDFNGTPVTDAEAHVFFSMDTDAVVGDEAEPLANTNGDSGNLMRYDPVADQYIFNWDLKTVGNGTYKVWVDLGEDACGQQHNVVLSVQKVGKGLKK
jgi:hypothetical protein